MTQEEFQTLKPGEKVRALCQIVDSDPPADLKPGEIYDNWVYAEPGDVGEVADEWEISAVWPRDPGFGVMLQACEVERVAL